MTAKLKRKVSPRKKPLLDAASCQTTPDELSDTCDLDSLSSEMEDCEDTRQSDDEFMPTISSSEDDYIEIEEGNKRYDDKHIIFVQEVIKN